MIFHNKLKRARIFILSLSLLSCKKLVDVDAPITSTVADIVYSSDATAISVLTGLYTDFSSGNMIFPGTIASLPLFTGLSSDELVLSPLGFATERNAYYTNNLSSSVAGFEFWTKFYGYIFRCNDAIENLDKSNDLTLGIKQQLLGEAKFMRAFLYFFIVNLYGEAPLIINTDYKINSLLARSSQSEIYQLIIQDLQEAQTLLNVNYLNGQLSNYTGVAERVRPNKSASAALLARVYLYTQNWASSELQATSVINNSNLYDTVSINNVFLKNNKEAIWQLQPVTSGATTNTFDAVTFIIPLNGPSVSNPVYLSNNLLNSFETDDKRRTNWIGKTLVSNTNYYYSNKYKVNAPGVAVSEYLTLLRLGELYLIRAEARAQQNNISGAQADLSLIRRRAGLPNTTSTDKSSLLGAILHERQVELFAESGHRLLDLKRTNNIDAIMTNVTPLKDNGAFWKSFKQLYPLPLTDLKSAPNLLQNPEY